MDADEKQHLHDLLIIRQRRLRELEKRQALQGVNTDPAVTIEIMDIKKEISQIKSKLQLLGTQVGLESSLYDRNESYSTNEFLIDPQTENIKQNEEIIVHCGDRIALKASSNGRYVQANNDTPTGDLIARGPEVDSWENFEIVDSETPFSYVKNTPIRYGGKIGLKALSNDHFVGVNYQDGQHVLTSCVDHVEPWETFTLMVHPMSKAKNGQVLRYGDRIALQAHGGEYIMAHKERNGILLAVAEKIDAWETFIVINPKEPK